MYQVKIQVPENFGEHIVSRGVRGICWYVCSSKSNHLRNFNTVRWELRHITTQPGVDSRKSEVIAFVVNAGMNIIANNIYVSITKRSFIV